MFIADHSQTQPPAPLAISAEHMQARMSAGDGAGQGSFFDPASASPLTYTQEKRPPYSPNGSQPFNIIETHDPETGEIVEFEVSGQQGIIPARYTITDHQNARNDRYAMRWALDSLLPGSRQSKCHRFRIPKRDVELKLSIEHQKGFFAGCEVCGSVWGCPLCAPKITERRRVEVSEAIERAKEMGFRVMLATFTVPHGLGDDVKVIRKKLQNAWSKMTELRAWKNMKSMVGLRESLRVLEVTYGANGWHPHFHALLILEQNDFPSSMIKDLWFPHWLHVCRKAGLGDPSPAAFDVDDGARAAQYVTKWGMDSELTKGHLKHGKKSVNPWDLLRVFTFGVDDRRISPELREVLRGLGIDKKRSAALWLDFFHGFKGAHQLHPSKGFRTLLGLGNAKSDQELAEEEIDPQAALLACLNLHWPDIQITRSNARLLNQAEDSPDLIPDLLALIREEAKKKRIERGRHNWKKQKKALAYNEQKCSAAEARERADGVPGGSEAKRRRPPG